MTERVDVTIEAPVGGFAADPEPNIPAGHILPLVPLDDVILHRPTNPFDFDVQGFPFAQQLYLNLVATMRAEGGLGLSANQVDVPLSVFVVDTGGEYPEGFFNPRIVDVSDETVLLEEGCLSFQRGLVVKVKRPKTCRVRYELLNGETVTRAFTGITARCVLHEMDHLFGVTMRDRANKIHWETATKKARRLNK